MTAPTREARAVTTGDQTPTYGVLTSDYLMIDGMLWDSATVRRSVNAHDDLVKAGTDILDYAGMDDLLDSDRNDNMAFGIRLGDLRKLRAALAKAGGAS